MIYKANDLILDISEMYSEFPQKLKDNYRKEFEGYSATKLLKVKEAIENNHEFKQAPTLPNVFKYMRESRISRNSAVKRSWFECQYCGTTFPIKTAVCPSCAWKKEHSMSDPVVKMSNEYPEGLKRVNSNCILCTNFIGQNPVPIGATCEAWGTFNKELKANKDCINCACSACCNEKARDYESTYQHSLISLEDHYWLEFYKNKNIVKGSVLRYSGFDYKNVTGSYTGHNPANDKDNWVLYRGE